MLSEGARGDTWPAVVLSVLWRIVTAIVSPTRMGSCVGGSFGTTEDVAWARALARVCEQHDTKSQLCVVRR